MRRFCFLVLLISAGASGQNVFPPIGSWREHLPYQSAVDVTASDSKIYCATLYSLFSIDPASKEVQRISKVSGLSETGISAIKYDPVSKKLFVAYTNSNIDVLDQKGIHTIPDLERKNISGDKSVYSIYPDDNYCYLSSGLGVIVVDAGKLEVKDSWFIGNSGGYVKTNEFTKANSFFYAATEEGLKKIAVSNSNPADFHNWQIVSGSKGLPAAACKGVVTLQNKVLALENDSIYLENGNGWNLFFTNGWPVLSISVSENKLIIAERKTTGEAQVLVVNNDGIIARTIQQPGIISFPERGVIYNNDYWIADLFGGLTHWTGNSFEQYKPNSPGDISSGEITVYNNVVYATAGSVNDSWNYQYNRSGVFKMADGWWTNYNQFSFPQLDTLLDFITVAVDPRDGTAWAGSFGGGLLHIKDRDQLEIYKQNSPIGPTIGDPTSYRVAGLAFDGNNNLWVANFGSDHQLRVLKNNGTWQSFAAPFTLFINAAAQIVIDDYDQKWIVSPLGNGLLVFNHGSSIDNLGDDRWKLYRSGAGAGNLPSDEVTSIAKDKNGFIWVGTTDGIGVIQCPQEVFANGCDAVWPTIKESNFANYLFKGQEVRSIAIDGANRKWVATSNGAWLISPDGDKVLAQLTEDNSSLLSSDVKKIAINGSTGEVFFATSKGICSFRGAATEATATIANVLVFPNPVPPGYNGTIGIRGLPENSIVKITEASGRLVYQTRALGGQAVWNGRDYKGNQVSSGIYLVLAEDDNKQEKAVGKIVFISK